MEDELLDNIVITLGQSNHDQHILDYLDQANGYKYKNPNDQLNLLDSILQTSHQDGAQFVMLPEFFLPRRFLFSYIKERAIRYRSIIMGGLEYGMDPSPAPSGKFRLKNEAFVVIPDNLYKKNHMTNGSATVITVPKLHPAPEEAKLLSKNGYEFVNGNRIYHFSSKRLGNFAVLICFDFLNLPVQAILQSQIQTLFVLTYNMDVTGFISIAETVQRLLLCNVAICNTGFFGGSVVFAPIREPRQKRQVLQINGNEIHAAVSVHLPIKEVWKVQDSGEVNHGEKKFFQLPPDFGRLAAR